MKEKFCVLAVGQRFPTPLPAQDTVIAQIGGTTLDLVIQINRMTERERRAMKEKTVVRAWQVGNVCGLVVKLGTMPWMDASINACLEPDQAATFIHEGGNALNYYVLDRGVIHKIGLFGLYLSDVELLKATFRKQLEVGIGNDTWDKALQEVYRRYSSDSLAQLAMAQEARKAEVAAAQDKAELTAVGSSTPACNILKLAQLEAFAVAGKKYPSPLPTELEPFYGYMCDGGHCIVAVVSDKLDLPDPRGSLCPVPVKTILRLGWTAKDGLVWCNVPYSSFLGLLAPEEDHEY